MIYIWTMSELVILNTNLTCLLNEFKNTVQVWLVYLDKLAQQRTEQQADTKHEC